MPDPGLIATLYAAGSSESRRASERTLLTNRHRLRPLDPGHDDSGLSVRPGVLGGLFAVARLQLRFDSLRRHQAGFVFGTSQDCDIVLPSCGDAARGLAPCHCLIAFDRHRRLVLRDLHGAGAGVRYRDKGGQTRSDCVWLLSGHRFIDRNTPIVVRLGASLMFRVEPASYDPDEAVYQDSVDCFPLGYVSALPGLSDSQLGLRTLDDDGGDDDDDELPGPDTVLLADRPLGRGGQARVERVWDPRSGRVYAAKVPHRDSSWRRLKREADLLARIDHDHVIRLVCVSASPERRLILEYASGGTVAKLAAEHALSADEGLTVVRQCLSALAYLHRGAIVHRDVKPANILVTARNPLCVKLSDFGHSKDVEETLKVRVGTAIYMAPEVRAAPSARGGSRYTSAVDIWSLGVVALELTHGLPAYGARYPKKLLRHLKDKRRQRHCPLLELLAVAMLVLEPSARSSVDECYAAFLHESLTCCLSDPASDGDEADQAEEVAADEALVSWASDAADIAAVAGADTPYGGYIPADWAANCDYYPEATENPSWAWLGGRGGSYYSD